MHISLHIFSVGNKSRLRCPGPTLLDPGVDHSTVAPTVVLLIFNLFVFRMANKTVKIKRNNFFLFLTSPHLHL